MYLTYIFKTKQGKKAVVADSLGIAEAIATAKYGEVEYLDVQLRD